jgi:hypothetical protein
MKIPPGRGSLLLYLDYDGVLHHEDVWWHARIGPYLRAPDEYKLFQHLTLLETLLAPFPQVNIILSTSWVRRYGCSKTAKELGPRLRQRVLGATFHSQMNEDLFMAMPRGRQVWEDVLRRKPRDWLALDDDGDGWLPESAEHFVKTHDHDGISDPQVLATFRTKLEAMCKARTNS